jgi:predicted lipoprotein with Yx(FWY)xxD motif
MRHFAASTLFAALLLVAPAAFAQDTAVQVAESQEYGNYLTDAEGKALYLFTRDTQGQGDTPPQISCTGDCLSRWPPLYTEGEPTAGENVVGDLLGTVEHEGRQMVTYNGWPLYYFAQDQEPGQTAGQGANDVWYLVSPEGEAIEQ